MMLQQKHVDDLVDLQRKVEELIDELEELKEQIDRVEKNIEKLLLIVTKGFHLDDV